ncbi:MAG: hypothetical protein B7X08_01715, partial [Acidocella sp. 20-63-7]
LALGFLFLEIFAIEKASLLLDDRASGFSLVLSTMLIFSGLGSFLSVRFARAPGRAVAIAVVVIALWAAGMLLLEPEVLGLGGASYGLRAGLVVLALAPVSIVMGLPFPLGLEQERSKFFLAWAWGLNGAFSVVATPLANLLLRQEGLHAVLGGAILMYGIAALSFPAPRRIQVWLSFMKRSAVAE